METLSALLLLVGDLRSHDADLTPLNCNDVNSTAERREYEKTAEARMYLVFYLSVNAGRYP